MLGKEQRNLDMTEVIPTETTYFEERVIAEIRLTVPVSKRPTYILNVGMQLGMLFCDWPLGRFF